MKHQDLISPPSLDSRLFLSEDRFKRAAKHLKKTLHDIPQPLSLQQWQETLSQSLGFHHFHELQQVWTSLDSNSNSPKSILPSSSSSRDSFFSSWMQSFHPDMMTFFFMQFLDQQGPESFWTSRARFLMNVVLSVLKDLHGQPLLGSRLSTLNHLLDLPFLVDCLVKHESLLSSSTKKIAVSYLRSLPGHGMPLSNDETHFQSFHVCSSTMEQHGFLSMQWIPVIQLLQAVEDHDTPLFRFIWFENQNPTGLTSLSIRSSLVQEHPDVLNSWLNDSSFLPSDFVRKTWNQKTSFLMSDLLYQILTLFDESQRKALFQFMHGLLQRYSFVISLTQRLDASSASF